MIKRIDNKDYIELKNIKRAKLGKEDIIVLSTEKNLHPEFITRIKEYFKKDFPDNKVIILMGGLKLSILKPYHKDEDISPLKAVSFIK